MHRLEPNPTIVKNNAYSPRPSGERIRAVKTPTEKIIIVETTLLEPKIPIDFINPMLRYLRLIQAEDRF